MGRKKCDLNTGSVCLVIGTFETPPAAINLTICICRVDELYHFLKVWVPHLYGELDEEKVTEQGFELVESDTELWDDENVEEDGTGTGDGDPDDLSRPSWEVSK